ncbi:MAG: Na+/H+ antiporter NhaC family protein [bacterium]
MKPKSHLLAGPVLLFVSFLILAPVTGASAQSSASISELSAKALELEVPKIVLRGVDFGLTVQAVDAEGAVVKSYSDSVRVTGISIRDTLGLHAPPTYFQLHHGRLAIPNAVLNQTGGQAVSVFSGTLKAHRTVRVIPGILSLMPPLIAIALAFLTRQTLISLFSGIWLGALFIYQYNPLSGFMRTLDTYLINALADGDHAAILLFSLTLGGMVGVISKAGGMEGIVEKLSKYANHPRGGQLATWLMGVLIFFDDYANTLIVGNTMRPFTDRLRISREKLSYIVDSTAAPVASIALVSTWIGFQVGLIDQALGTIGLNQDAYSVFFYSIPYASYSILALVFVLLIGISLRDFGPMRRAELRASQHGKVLRDGAQPIADSTELGLADAGTPLRWYNALLPISIVILVTLVGLYTTGTDALGAEARDASLGEIFGKANSFHALMWAAFSGLLVASLAALSQRILTLNQTLTAALSGYKSMMLAAMILILAWAIGTICKDLHTADYVIAASQGLLSPHLVPVLTFLVAAFISFSTGSSWATMAILTPIVVPIAYELPLEASLSASLSNEILIGTVGAILSGSVLGDHCSPISDTTILSSMATAADHVDHVRTQMPYAIVVGVVACLTGYLPNGWGLHPLFSLLLGTAILVTIVYTVGKRSVFGKS